MEKSPIQTHVNKSTWQSGRCSSKRMRRFEWITQQCLLHLYSGIIGNDRMAQQEGIKLHKRWCFHTMGEGMQPLTTKLPKMIYCHGTWVGEEERPQAVCIILHLFYFFCSLFLLYFTSQCCIGFNTPFKRNVNLHLYSSCFKVTLWWMFKLFIYFSFVHLWVVLTVLPLRQDK